ncbi:MAG: class I SAM-dependent methyltransferase [Clostridia bacterium]|nr:class I SAM-dependent methyltransferase [Clostridia bacterium]
MTNAQWDKKLRIRTGGREDNHADRDHHPYEPTPYSVLERVAAYPFLDHDRCLIDYGCGKGRAAIMLSALTGCRSIGVEFDPGLCREAERNRLSCPISSRLRFDCADAETYGVTDADAFYFFNPFSALLLQGVLRRILDSYYASPRPMRLFFYYPSDEYRSLLMTHPELTMLDEIDCRDLFEGSNPRECVLVFAPVGGI